MTPFAPTRLTFIPFTIDNLLDRMAATMMQGSRLLCIAQRCCRRRFYSRQSLSTLAAVEHHILPNDDMTDELAELVDVSNACLHVCWVSDRRHPQSFGFFWLDRYKIFRGARHFTHTFRHNHDSLIHRVRYRNTQKRNKLLQAWILS